MANDTEVIKKFKAYNGNQLLKREGVVIDWTPELIQEYVKCAEDPIYFIETYMRIINVDEGLVSFKLYDYQKTMVNSMKDNRYTIITTARQTGKSTTTCGFILWYIIFQSEKTVALLANKGATAREILGKIQLAYQHLPKWLQQGVGKWNEGSFELENNSRVIATATTADNIRGYAVNLVFIDEAAFVDNWDEFFTSVFPTISSGQTTKIVLVSTPNGLNHFYKLWTDANEERNGYNPIQVMWYEVPTRNEEWKEETLKSMGNDIEKFEQEYCCSFLGSSNTLIASWKLKELAHRRPEFERLGIKQYFQPQKRNRYVMTVDVSRGKGLDYSAFQIIDVSKMPYVQVCTFRSNQVVPPDYAEIIVRMAKLYNEAQILVEINDIGQQVSDLLYHEHEYVNILSTQHNGKMGKRIASGFGGKQIERGITTTKSVKAVGCSLLKLLVEQNQLVLYDYDTIMELSTFSKRANSYEAENGCHDDTVMPLVLFAWLSDQQWFKDFTDINTLVGLREVAPEDISEDLLPFGFIENGYDESEEPIIDLNNTSRHWLHNDF